MAPVTVHSSEPRLVASHWYHHHQHTSNTKTLCRVRTRVSVSILHIPSPITYTSNPLSCPTNRTRQATTPVAMPQQSEERTPHLTQAACREESTARDSVVLPHSCGVVADLLPLAGRIPPRRSVHPASPRPSHLRPPSLSVPPLPGKLAGATSPDRSSTPPLSSRRRAPTDVSPSRRSAEVIFPFFPSAGGRAPSENPNRRTRPGVSPTTVVLLHAPKPRSSLHAGMRHPPLRRRPPQRDPARVDFVRPAQCRLCAPPAPPSHDADGSSSIIASSSAAQRQSRPEPPDRNPC
ncbi:uncharacterized protein M6B38_182060 [Iris pallida]|uniref:Uncharacterized protein n=1 Tax=Iris pallida TaxID=29817 RepID=A0AAX6EMC9_IRIPA|nr:uncharacterized protein M6B38_182060 [Iris pallida]